VQKKQENYDFVPPKKRGFNFADFILAEDGNEEEKVSMAIGNNVQFQPKKQRTA
jgi:hypothetical protein